MVASLASDSLSSHRCVIVPVYHLTIKGKSEEEQHELKYVFWIQNWLNAQEMGAKDLYMLRNQNLTFSRLLIVLFPIEKTWSSCSVSRFSILEILLLYKLRSCNLTNASKPSMSSILLKDKSVGTGLESVSPTKKPSNSSQIRPVNPHSHLYRRMLREQLLREQQKLPRICWMGLGTDPVNKQMKSLLSAFLTSGVPPMWISSDQKDKIRDYCANLNFT